METIPGSVSPIGRCRRLPSKHKASELSNKAQERGSVSPIGGGRRLPSKNKASGVPNEAQERQQTTGALIYHKRGRHGRRKKTSPQQPASLIKQAIARRWLHLIFRDDAEPNASAPLSEMLKLHHTAEVRNTIIAEASRLLRAKSKKQNQHNKPKCVASEQSHVLPASNHTAGSIRPTCKLPIQSSPLSVIRTFR
jgi:hypothetical protein